MQRNSREREAVGLPVAFACPVWRWRAGDHIKASLHIMGQVDMWLHSNHHQPTNVCSMQAVLLISSRFHLRELDVGHLDVPQSMRGD